MLSKHSTIVQNHTLVGTLQQASLKVKISDVWFGGNMSPAVLKRRAQATPRRSDACVRVKIFIKHGKVVSTLLCCHNIRLQLVLIRNLLKSLARFDGHRSQKCRYVSKPHEPPDHEGVGAKRPMTTIMGRKQLRMHWTIKIGT